MKQSRVQFLKKLLREPGEIVACPVQYGGHRRVLQTSLITTTEDIFYTAVVHHPTPAPIQQI